MAVQAFLAIKFDLPSPPDSKRARVSSVTLKRTDCKLRPRSLRHMLVDLNMSVTLKRTDCRPRPKSLRHTAFEADLTQPD